MFEDTIPNFEALAALAKEDPIEFETLRDQLCKQLLEQAPEHISQHLKGLQFKINIERQRPKTPLKSCLELSKLMNNSLIELEKVLSNPQEFLREHNLDPQIESKGSVREENTSAKIIQLFPKPPITPKNTTISKPTTSED